MSPLLLGHRGHRLPRLARLPRQGHRTPAPEDALLEVENSAAAFERSLAAGCDGFELDLHRSADGVLVVHHDAFLPDRRRSPLASLTLAELRVRLPRLPTLAEILQRWQHRAWMDLEIKASGIEPELVRLLRQWMPTRGCVVSSFRSQPLARVAALAPHLPLCLNLRRPRRLARLRPLGVAWIAPHQGLCTAWYVRQLRAQGWRVLVWTVNHPAKMRRLSRAGADAIVCDDPYLLVRTLRPNAQ